MGALASELQALVAENRRIHDQEGIHLNPATNTMNPRAEAMMAAGLGARASLGYPGDKYEMGLQAIERIEVIAAELAAEVFGARFAEVRVGSAAKRLRRANLLACGIGLPVQEVAGDNNGLRLGVPELVRLGMDADDMPALAQLLLRALTGDPEPVAADVMAFRRRFSGLHYILP